MYYKLIDAINTPKDLSVVTRNGSAVRYGRMRLEPKKKYEIPEDKTLWESILNAKEKTRWTKEREDLLKETGAKYSVVRCKSCGGRVLKLEYNVVEVVDE